MLIRNLALQERDLQGAAERGVTAPPLVPQGNFPGKRDRDLRCVEDLDVIEQIGAG